MKNNLFALIIILVYLSAWTTNLLGVHPIFGAFLFGLVLPRKGRFVVELTEKIEEFVRTLLLPLYFAYSGLKTNISAINSSTAGGLMVRID
jgi:Kef-type K+ transport system membrane component KefB